MEYKDVDQDCVIYSQCGYFADKTSQAEYYTFPTKEEAELAQTDQLRLYSHLLAHGWRRSGTILYRNSCPDCTQCIPIRIVAAQFYPTKSQRHVLRKNADLSITITKTAREFISPQKIRLLQAYNRRHEPDKETSATKSEDMLATMNGIIHADGSRQNHRWYDGTINMDYYYGEQLVACSILDFAQDSLSSNYFYYDISPDMLKRSLGTLSILKEIELCKTTGIDFYYLGYWLPDCHKMSYKAQFKPHEILMGNTWQTVAGTHSMPPATVCCDQSAIRSDSFFSKRADAYDGTVKQ